MPKRQLRVINSPVGPLFQEMRDKLREIQVKVDRALKLGTSDKERIKILNEIKDLL